MLPIDNKISISGQDLAFEGLPMQAMPTTVSAVLLLALLGAGAPRRADAAAMTVSLDNVVFADGGTAAGIFSLNVIDFLSAPIALATTTGTTLLGVSYDPVFAVAQTPPPSTGFDFNSTNYVFVLHLETDQPVGVTSSGTIGLVAGGGAPGAYTGSYEECVSSAITCGVAFETARFVVSGDLVVPEPASLAILGVSVIALAGLRWPGRPMWRPISRRSA
jgi:hypothetical protein